MINNALTKYNIQRDLRKDSIHLHTKFKIDHHKGVFSLFVYPNMSRSIFPTLILSLFSGVLLIGCGSQQPRSSEDTQVYTDQSSVVFAPEPVPSQPTVVENGTVIPAVPVQSKNIGGWSIVLSTVGRGGMERATEMLRIIKEDAGLEEAFIDDRPTGMVIAYGDYLDRNDPQAVTDLARIKKIDMLGVKLFESAVITPPSSDALRGSTASHDLRTVKERYGDRAVYTLQIGIYGRTDYQMPKAEDLVEFRRAAEGAVRDLRNNGVMAFYYHAPARSMVTVGVFSERDFDSSTFPPTQSSELARVREQFPNNLLNGQGINETVRTESGKITRLQSSQLVGIPEK